MEGENSDEFQLVPKSEIEKLRKEVADVKKNPIGDYESSLTLIEAMDKLADQLSSLISLFERTNKQMHEEYKKGFHQDAEKLDTLIHQNEKIAKGILALADNSHSAPMTDSSYEDNETDYPLSSDSDTAPRSRRSMMREFS